MPPRPSTLDFFELRIARNGTQQMLHCKQQGCHAIYQPPGKRGGTGTMSAHMQSKHPKVWQAHLAHKQELVDMTATAAAAAPAAAAAALDEPVAIEMDDGDSVVGAAAAACAASPVASAASKRSNSTFSSASILPAAKRPFVQQSLHSALASSNNAALVDTTALFFASNHIAHNVADSPSFHSFITAVRSSNAPVPRRRTLKASISHLADRLREKVVQRIRTGTAPVTVAIDGWTNVRHTKVTNVVLLHSGAAYYWCSIPNTYDANTAAWLSDQLVPLLQELVRLGIRFSALVADNESVNDALFSLLLEPFPFLIRVPCAAHTIQLVVKRVIGLRKFEKTLSSVRALIAHFEQKKSERQRLRMLQRTANKFEYALVKPNDTRWNSQLYACIRILKLRQFLSLILPQQDTFWAELSLLIDFLTPFQQATDAIQKDAATLHDIWVQVNVLHRHITQDEAKYGRSLTKRAAQVLKQRWDKQVNGPATMACVLLSLTADLSQVKGQLVDEAKKFILDFGCSYLSFYNLAEDLEGDVLRGTLITQLGAFVDRRDGFASVEEEVRVLTAAARAQDLDASINPLDVWAQHSGALSLVAKALLSITASEAAVERSFSAQDAVHTKKRNRLLDAAVQQEMFVKFNSRALDRSQQQHFQRASPTIDLDPDVEVFLQESHSDSDAESVSTAVSESADPSLSQQGEGEAAGDGAAAAAAPARSPSVLDAETEKFLDHYIAVHGISPEAIRSRRYWNGDRTNALQHAATEKLGLGSATVGELIRRIAQHVQKD